MSFFLLSCRLSRGRENVLFHFIHYNDLEGILVTPADLDFTLSPGHMQNEVMANFHRSVLNIHALFGERDAEENQVSQYLGQGQVMGSCAGHHGLGSVKVRP